MALSQSALSDLLEAFRAGDGVDLIGESVRVGLQELIEIGAAERIDAAPYERTETASPTATVTGPGCCRPRPAMSSCGSPSCVEARSSR